MEPEPLKRTSKGGGKGSAAKKKVFETHHVSGLVGQIVEKSFTATTSLPQPTVLPFPVARHRSQGPHWAPASLVGVEYDEEEKYETCYDPLSAFAKPVKRREKKGMDFSGWKEYISDESIAEPRFNAKQSKKPLKERCDKERYFPPAITSMPINVAEDSVPESCDIEVELSVPEILVGGKKSQLPEAKEGFPNSVSLMDDISSENLSRLEKMTTEEIEDARANILEKLDPGLVEKLKKRGRDKLGKKIDGILEKDQGQVNINRGADPKRAIVSSTDPGRNYYISSAVPGGSSWKEWSERVEKVRDLRFSLEGEVIDFDGKSPESAPYNAENIAERDFLRTDGDPAAVGYTLKEALALLRSVVPGQRALALYLLNAVLNRALHYLQKNTNTQGVYNLYDTEKFVDWQAIWAYALGAEPKMALSLRIALDDNHESVVLACAKVIQCILSCDLNEKFFAIRETTTNDKNGVYTAPVFRSRPAINGSFLKGGFWKYNTKPSNILPFDEEEDDENEEKRTIQDDVVVAEQDFAAGLIRMGVFSRICYLLEMEASPDLVECLLSILIALARHSPSSAFAATRSSRLFGTVVKLLTLQVAGGMLPCQIKATIFLKVLFCSKKQICIDLVNSGAFQGVMWQWYKNPSTLDEWLTSGFEECKLTSVLMVEQLRFWKVCIEHGECISHFSDFFPSMVFWLNVPNFDKLVEHNRVVEFISVSREAYLVLEALSRKLPVLHSVEELDNNSERWSWSLTVPIVDIATAWLKLKNIPYVSSLMMKHSLSDVQNPCLFSVLGVISAVLYMLCSVLDRIAPENSEDFLPWLPQFVPRVGLEFIRSGFLKFSGFDNLDFGFEGGEGASLAVSLCHLQLQADPDRSTISSTCLSGLVRLVICIDRCIQRARNANNVDQFKESKSGIAGKVLEEGMTRLGKFELKNVLSLLMVSFSEKWHVMQFIELFGRGGPAPGVGVGWGCLDGGFWSPTVLRVQVDAQLILDLFKALPWLDEDEHFYVKSDCKMISQLTKMNQLPLKILAVLGIFLVAGPGDQFLCDQALDLLLQFPVLKFLNLCIRQILLDGGRELILSEKEEEDYYVFLCRILKTHFRNRWLDCKKFPVAMKSREAGPLETIQEESEVSDAVAQYSECGSLITEWAHQRFPLPSHWFLSAISSVEECKSTGLFSSSNALDILKCGAWVLLGLEAMQIEHFNSRGSPISCVPLVWKLHALSMSFLVSVDFLEEERSKKVFESLQEIYGRELDRLRQRHTQSVSLDLEKGEERNRPQFLNFEMQIHESYTTLVEKLVEQFGAVSYGDVIFGRQIALYLHRAVEPAVRLSAWNLMSDACVLDLLPPLEKCISDPEGYLEPVEDNENILEAYAKTLSSGGLDRAAVRNSVSFTLALHHLSSFIFSPSCSRKLLLRNKLVKSLLRSYSQKRNQEDILLRFIEYRLTASKDRDIELRQRFSVLKECCEENSSLIGLVKKMNSVATI